MIGSNENHTRLHLRSIIGEHIVIILENVKARDAQLISFQNLGPNGVGFCVALKREDMVTLHRTIGDMLGLNDHC